ncbi:hypothetical protein ACYSNW_04605 [Enterococcus sp. LJL99]
MIDREDLKDWMKESERQKSIEKLEKYIDKVIKANVLEGKYTFFVTTGTWGERSSEKTEFYDLWYDETLSKNNQSIVHNKILDKYTKNGFNVKIDRVDCGWNHQYLALKFSNVNELVEQKKTNKDGRPS